MNLHTNEYYSNNHISLEYIIRTGWSRGNNISMVVEECCRMGYEVDRQYVLDKFNGYNLELEYENKGD